MPKCIEKRSGRCRVGHYPQRLFVAVVRQRWFSLDVQRLRLWADRGCRVAGQGRMYGLGKTLSVPRNWFFIMCR
jgi:hypothetical protein